MSGGPTRALAAFAAAFPGAGTPEAARDAAARSLLDTLASSRASGTLQSEHDGTWAKRLQPGLAASGGVLAVRLAARGFRGPRDALEGRFGFFPLYLRDFDPAPVLHLLGQRFEVERTSLKPFPTCRFTHAPLAALQEALKGRALQPPDIDAIEARVTSGRSPKCASPSPRRFTPQPTSTPSSACPTRRPGWPTTGRWAWPTSPTRASGGRRCWRLPTAFTA